MLPPRRRAQARAAWSRHPHDPEHLVVSGGGGAFLHPTHVFAAARFPAPHDPAADATAGLYAAVMQPCTCRCACVRLKCAGISVCWSSVLVEMCTRACVA